MKSIIITGANSGIGFECTLEMAKIAPDDQLILACRNVGAGMEALQRIQQQTSHEKLICLPLDLASLQSIREFRTAFVQLPNSTLAVLVNNAGIQHIGKTTYTTDGFEATFGVNHLGTFYLTLLLLPSMEKGSSITFTASATHDPAEKTEIEPPVFTTIREMAFPGEAAESDKKTGQRRYSTSKLCNIMTTYLLHEKLKDTGIRVNAFDPGFTPGTGLAKGYPPIFRFAWKHILPMLNRFRKNAHTPAESGKRLANLAYGVALRQLNGSYFSNGNVTKSSADSYNPVYQSELWKESIELTGIQQQDTNIPLTSER